MPQIAGDQDLRQRRDAPSHSAIALLCHAVVAGRTACGEQTRIRADARRHKCTAHGAASEAHRRGKESSVCSQIRRFRPNQASGAADARAKRDVAGSPPLARGGASEAQDFPSKKFGCAIQVHFETQRCPRAVEEYRLTRQPFEHGLGSKAKLQLLLGQRALRSIPFDAPGVVISAPAPRPKAASMVSRSPAATPPGGCRIATWQTAGPSGKSAFWTCRGPVCSLCASMVRASRRSNRKSNRAFQCFALCAWLIWLIGVAADICREIVPVCRALGYRGSRVAARMRELVSHASGWRSMRPWTNFLFRRTPCSATRWNWRGGSSRAA